MKPGPRARDAKRLLSSLFVDPKSEQPQARGFNLKLDNWLRTVKVPILVLNATSLNTGHNWQFTASWTGAASRTRSRDRCQHAPASHVQ